MDHVRFHPAAVWTSGVQLKPTHEWIWMAQVTLTTCAASRSVADRWHKLHLLLAPLLGRWRVDGISVGLTVAAQCLGNGKHTCSYMFIHVHTCSYVESNIHYLFSPVLMALVTHTILIFTLQQSNQNIVIITCQLICGTRYRRE